MHSLSLTAYERRAFDWVGSRYNSGKVADLLLDCIPDDHEWGDDADVTSPSGSAWSVTWSLPSRAPGCPVWLTVPPTHAPSSPSESSKVASRLQVASRTASAVRHRTVSSCRLRREVPTRALPEASLSHPTPRTRSHNES